MYQVMLLSVTVRIFKEKNIMAKGQKPIKNDKKKPAKTMKEKKLAKKEKKGNAGITTK